MSRTYRLRHLPMYPSQARGWKARRVIRKVVDGRGNNDYFEAQIRALAEAEYGAPYVPKHYFDPTYGDHVEYVKTSKKEPIYQYNWKLATWLVIGERPIWETVIKPGSWRTNPDWHRWEEIENRIRRDFVWPVSSWHPLERGMRGRSKKRGRTMGNRRFRHTLNQTVRMFDPDEDILPELKEHYSVYDL